MADNLGSEYLPILIRMQIDFTFNSLPHRTSFNIKKEYIVSRYRKSGEKYAFQPTVKKEKYLAYHNSESRSLTGLFNDSGDLEASIVIPIPKLGKDSFLCTSYRAIFLLYPAAKAMEALMLSTANTHLIPATDQHGLRHRQFCIATTNE